MCRHEAQAEYTNPAAAWHQIHTDSFTKAESDSERESEQEEAGKKTKQNERIWK